MNFMDSPCVHRRALFCIVLTVSIFRRCAVPLNKTNNTFRIVKKKIDEANLMINQQKQKRLPEIPGY